jgi:hypothetical protein
MRDPYGTVMKRGQNMSVLNRARNHYVDKEIRIKEYFFSLDCSQRKVVKGDEDFLEKCDICKLPLFKFILTEHLETGSKVIVVPKRKLLFVDSNSVHYSCCYKQGECLARVHEEPNDEPLAVVVPTFEEFIGSDSQSSSVDVLEIERSAKLSYDHHVKPFIAYWRDKEITKNNMMKFLVNFKTLLEGHLIYYDEYTGDYPHNNHLAIENKILALIGVRKN